MGRVQWQCPRRAARQQAVGAGERRGLADALAIGIACPADSKDISLWDANQLVVRWRRVS